jgi:hypothetical protein
MYSALDDILLCFYFRFLAAIEMKINIETMQFKENQTPNNMTQVWKSQLESVSE